jgi:tetratricopeptide (TPR) repeat protein
VKPAWPGPLRRGIGLIAASWLMLSCSQPASGERSAASGAGTSEAELARQVKGRLERLPDDPDLLLSSAKLLLTQGSVPEGVLVLRRLVKLDADRCDAYQLLADAYLELEDEEAAFASLRACLAANPDHREVLFSLGGMLASRHPDEMDSLKEAISLWERYQAVAASDPHSQMVIRALPRLKQRLAGIQNQGEPAGETP